jgi:hypothetical protein
MKKENIFYGNIEVATENQKEINKLLKTITKITGSIYLGENAKAEFPVLTTSGSIYLGENAKAEFPVLTTSGSIYLRENAKAEFPVLTTSNYTYLRENAKAEFPVLTTSNSIYLSENAKAEFPVLTTSNYIDLRENAKAEFPVLTTSGSIYLSENAKAEFPVLTTSNSIDLGENAKAEFPVLTTSGSIDLRENAKAEFPVLTTSGNIYLSENAKIIHPKTKRLNYKSVDNSMFVMESEKTSKGVRIYSGYIFLKFDKKEIIKTVCFVAEKDNLFAHGETVKKAIQDLNFKIIAEKLKNEPIKKDTIITIQYYRLITGACEMGVNSWINNVFNEKEKAIVLKNGIKAKDLLPILEGNNAYGIERFKQLLTF